MINSKDDYKFYKKADEIALGRAEETGFRRRLLLSYDYVWKFERLLRKTEYYQNCATSSLGRTYYNYLNLSLHKLKTKLGFIIPTNCFGPGLSIGHVGTIVVNQAARIGCNCRIHACVVIAGGEVNNSPKIGNNVYIGPGAKIFGDITIANGIRVGANSVVNKSFLEPNITIAGIPAKKVSPKGSGVVNATEILKKMHPKYAKYANAVFEESSVLPFTPT